MENFSTSELTSTGAVKILSDEVQVLSANNVSISRPKQPGSYSRGILTVTTHRIVWSDAQATHAIAAALSLVKIWPAVVDKSSLRTPRLLLYFREGHAVELVFGRLKDKDNARSALVRSLRTREWLRAAKAEAKKKEEEKKRKEFDPTRVGIGGVIRTYRKDTESRSETISQAFKDLDSLMNSARELVAIASRFQASTTKTQKTDPKSSPDDAFVDMMAEMGIDSPVTKEASGGNTKLYLEQLARQLAEFLIAPLEQVGGLMTLTDVYCVYNRKRATTELVSPDDLVAACKLLPKLNVGMRLIKLESGVNAIELSGPRRDVGAERLQKMAEEKGALRPVELMGILRIPIQRVLAMLYDAEQRGLLCRDETESGLQFFPNEFTRGIW